MQMYYTPKNELVARLFGEPEINLAAAELFTEEGMLKLRCLQQETPLVPEADAAGALKSAGITGVDLGIRGIDISFNFSPQDSSWIKGNIYAFEPIGNKVIITVDVNGSKIRIAAANNISADLDQTVYLKFDMKNALYFNAETGAFITRSGIQRYT
jgi:multiple sugar transport system ATP-binding protein